MIPRRRQRARIRARFAHAAAIAAAAWGVGCKVDPDRQDAAPPADAGAMDAAVAADASEDCPDGLAYEVLATSWTSGAPLGGVQIVEVGEPANTAQTTGDGRGSLCLSRQGGAVFHDHPDRLAHVAEVAPEAAALAGRGGDVFRAALLTPIEADDVFIEEIGLPRDPTAAQILVEIRSYPGGEPLEGARAELVGATFAGPYTGSPGELFELGDTLDGTYVAFVNVEPGPPEAELVITPPASYEGRCAAPPAASIVRGGFAYALVACELD